MIVKITMIKVTMMMMTIAVITIKGCDDDAISHENNAPTKIKP